MIKYTLNDKELCMCPCHTINKSLLHFTDCCDKCYKKYIDEKGEIMINEFQPSDIIIVHIIIKDKTS